jgi:hypothetical protein
LEVSAVLGRIAAATVACISLVLGVVFAMADHIIPFNVCAVLVSGYVLSWIVVMDILARLRRMEGASKAKPPIEL